MQANIYVAAITVAVAAAASIAIALDASLFTFGILKKL